MARSLRPIQILPITTRFLEVIRSEAVTPGMQRVTLGGEQLKAHTAENGYPVQEFISDGFDDEFKVLIKHPDVDVAVGPTQADGVLNWPRGDEHMLMRTYTVRDWRPDAGDHGELDVDFVVHGVGPATSWARKAAPGDIMQIAGPKSCATHPEGADWTLVIGDETALPAIGRWLEQWPAGERGKVFIEVEQDNHRQDLVVPEGVELTWLVRHGAEAGTTTLLFDALRATDWWDGKVFAWAAGEAGTLKPIRRWLKSEKALAKDQLDITGYWLRQEVTVSEDNPEVQDFDASENIRTKFHDLAEIVPGFALRVAATIGLGPALGDATRSFEEILAATNSNSEGLFKLLRYLEAVDVVAREGSGTGVWSLTELGKQLDDDGVIGHISLTSSHGHREVAAMVGLLDAVRTGSQPESYEESPELAKDRIESQSQLGAYVSPMVADLPQFAGTSTVAICGNAAVTFASALTHKYPELQVTVVAKDEDLSVYRAVESIPERVTLSTEFPQVDVALLTDPIPALPDGDAVELLRQAAAHSTTFLLFTRLLNPERATDHDYEHDLQDFVLDGGGARTAADYAELFHAAGLKDPQRATIGWGFTLHDFH